MGSNVSRRRLKKSKDSRTVRGYLAKLRYVNKVISNTYYFDFVDHMKQVLELSTDPKLIGDPVGHLDVQKVIYIVLEKLEPLITQGRRESIKTKDKSLLVQAHRNKLVAAGYREIADGLAWKTLGYDRARLRILAEADSPGFIATPDGPKIGRNAEFHYAQNVIDNNAFVLIHDVTNQLLVGDLSMVRKFGDIPHLAEVKSKKLITPSTISKKIDKSMKLSSQEDRLIQAQLLMEKDEIGKYTDPAKVRRINVPVITFHDNVRQSIKIAREKGVSRIQPAKYINIEIVDFHKKDLNPEEVTGVERPFEGEEILQFSNFDSIALKMDGLIMRGKTPYSVYPYEIADRIDLMTGGLYLHVVLSIDRLKDDLVKKGWKLEVNIPDDRKPYQDVKFGGNELFRGTSEKDLVVKLVHFESGFTIKMSMDFFTRIGHEFFTLDDIMIPYIDKMNQAIGAQEQGISSFIFPVNDSEKDIWD